MFQKTPSVTYCTPHYYTHQTSQHCLFVSQTLTSNGSNSPEIGCDSTELLDLSQENQFPFLHTLYALKVLRGKVPCFSLSMQSEKTSSGKPQREQNRCRCHQKVIIKMLVFCVIFLFCFLLFSLRGGGNSLNEITTEQNSNWPFTH